MFFEIMRKKTAASYWDNTVYAQVPDTSALGGHVGAGKQDWSLIPCTLSSLRRCLMILGGCAMLHAQNSSWGRSSAPNLHALMIYPL
jgi:hypothetical protein